MGCQPLRILQVNTFDVAGGAEKVSWQLFAEYRRRGYPSWLAVGRKRSDDPDVFRMPHHLRGHLWSRSWWRAHLRLQPLYRRGWAGRFLCRATHRLAAPAGLVDYWRGHEDFNYPGAWRLLDATPQPPTVVHCHNLHGKYFDLRALVALSRRVPVFVTLHDAWMFTGHCAHSFDCERWEAGCGECPALGSFPAVRRDATSFNWRRKRDIYTQCRLHVAAPCQWLLDRAKRSILAPAIVEARVIHNGVDLGVFRPADKQAARAALGIPSSASVLLIVGNSIRRNPYKDYQTVRVAFAQLAQRAPRGPLLLLALGEDAPPETVGSAQIRFVPFQNHPADVARYYQAADVHVHAARADTFPTSVLEALACGTPVVATAVGGIPEQVVALAAPGRRWTNVTYASSDDRATGILVAPGSAEELAAGLVHLLDRDKLRRQSGVNAASDARRRFDLRRQADEYLAWYSTATHADPRSANCVAELSIPPSRRPEAAVPASSP